MMSFDLLEEKFVQLAQLVNDLRKENKQLADKNSDLEASLVELRAENERLALQSLQLAVKLDEFDKTLDGAESFNEERIRTKEAVDSLIKNIESLVSFKEEQL